MTDREQYAPAPASGAQFRRFWFAHMDALERHLDRMEEDQATPTKGKNKQKTTRPNRERHKGETK